MTAPDAGFDPSVTAGANPVWVSSITRDGLVTIPATVIDRALGSVTIRAAARLPFACRADVILTGVHDGDQRLGRILAIEGLTLRITLADAQRDEGRQWSSGVLPRSGAGGARS